MDPVNLYSYIPELGFNAFGAAAYGALVIAHLVWFVKYPRTRWVEAHMLAFCACELAVYAARSASASNPFVGSLWVTQYCLGMFAPTGLILAMLLAMTKAYKSTVDGRSAVSGRPKLTFLLLAGAQAVIGLLILMGSLFTGNNRTIPGAAEHAGDSGRYLLLAALAVQVILLTAIQGILTWTAITIKRGRATASPTDPAIPDPKLSRTMLILLFLTVGMVWVRSIFRLAESAEGWDGYAGNAEFNYGFWEFAMVWVAGTIWTVWPFARVCDRQQGQLLPEDSSIKGKDVSQESHVSV